MESAVEQITSTPPQTPPTGTESKTEEVKVEGADTPKKEEPDVKAARFAELSKKEQRILRRQMEGNAQLKKREEDLTKRESVIKEYEEIKTLAKTNPTEAIKRIGTDYKTLTDHILNGEKLTPELVANDVNTKLKALEDRIAAQDQEIKNKEEKFAQEENARILKTFDANIVSTVQEKKDEFPLIFEFNGAPVIREMVQQRWEQTNGKHLMTIDESMKLLEKDLEGLVERVLKTPKYASRLSQQPKNDPKPNSLNKPKTITNEMTSTAPSFLPKQTEDARIKRALEKLA